ncbi:MAG: hypothetical protein A2283_00435 [Lentisphaerae bacterium RIFOXYA12_FULL_48_11]|nr:MAG: hypothetical protein A2283_00435 [Lentisphaerae bacterium RIFOXYA12_FULL_48_11]
MIADYWLLPPWGFGAENFIDIVGLGLFAIMGATISIMAERYRLIRYHLLDLVDERTKELNDVNTTQKHFNTELEQRIADKTVELRRINETLEQRIAERTKETLAANKELQNSRRAALNLMDDAIAARKNAEQVSAYLREERDFTTAVLDNTGAMVVVLDREGRITRFNRACESITGYTLAEVSGRVFWEFLVPPEDLPGVSETWAKLRAGDFPNQHENHWLTKDSARRLIDWSNTAITRPDGGVEYIIATGIDITARRETEQALQSSEERLRRAQEIAHLGSWELDLVQDRLVWSDEVYHIFGLKAQEFCATYEAFIERIHPDDRAAVSAAYSGSLREGRDSYEIEHRIVRKDTGEIRVVHERCQHFRDAAGKIIRSDGMVHDITDRKVAEENLRWSARRNELLSETSAKLLAAENPQGLVNELCNEVLKFLNCQTFFNFLVDKPAGKLRLNACTGISKEDVAKIEWLDFGVAVCGCVARDCKRIIAEDIPNTPDPRTDLIRSYGVQAYCCHPLMDGDRMIGTLSFGTRTRPRFNSDEISVMKTVSNLVAIAMARMQAGEDLHRTATELVRSNKDLEQFAHVTSHDLKEPLRMVTGFMSLLKERYGSKLDAKAMEYIGFAAEAGIRMQKMVDDLLAYSRAGRGDIFEPIDITGVVESALRNLKIAIEESGTVITQDPLPIIKGSPLGLTQVFQNLIANAIKFRKPGTQPEIHIGARRVNGHSSSLTNDSMTNDHLLMTNDFFWLFSIRDNGIGIDPQFTDRIFMIFQRLHTRVEYPGSGVGLAICKKIVEQQGGRIWVESKPEKGSIFYFTMPDIKKE